MIMSAKIYIYIPKPLLYSDQSYINALKMAANAGVDV